MSSQLVLYVLRRSRSPDCDGRTPVGANRTDIDLRVIKDPFSFIVLYALFLYRQPVKPKDTIVLFHTSVSAPKGGPQAPLSRGREADRSYILFHYY